MIRCTRVNKTVWLVEDKHGLTRITRESKRLKPHERLAELRYIVSRATGVPVEFIRHMANTVSNGQWVTEWFDIREVA